MIFVLLRDLVQQIAVFVALAFVIGRLRLLRRLTGPRLGRREWLVLVAGCGLLSILGTYWGIEVQGALANTRVIGAVLAGLLGGPGAGLAAGLIGGLHRMSLGGFTAVACGVSTTVEGLLGGLVRARWGDRAASGAAAFATTAAAEALQMLIILALARPFGEAWALVQTIALPMTVANAIGAGLTMAIFQDSREFEERLAAAQAKTALDIANRTLPYLRSGLTRATAQKAAELIQAATGVAAASITDGRRILGYAGLGADHHQPGCPPWTEACREVLRDGERRAVNDVRCTVPGCMLGGGVVVPLKAGDEVVGTLNLFERAPKPVSPVTVELAAGLGQLLSTQMEIARLQAASELAAQAELRALQAQINPHFLFNALNTVAALCRRDPERARETIFLLSQYLRSSIRAGQNVLVTLEEELGIVQAYVAIEQARFGSRLKARFDVPAELLRAEVPILSLQPLVENGVRHGLMPLPAGGTVAVRARRQGTALVVEVADDGVGIAGAGQSAGTGVGLSNVRERLRCLYGEHGRLAVDSAPGKGTRVELRMPYKEAVTSAGTAV